jgi:hypothetical protein
MYSILIETPERKTPNEALPNRNAALRLYLPLLQLCGSILPPKLSRQYSWKWMNFILLN